MIETLTKNRKFIFYFLIVAVILVSSVSVIWLPPEYTAAKSMTPESLPLLAFLPLFAYIFMMILPVVYKKYDKEPLVWGHRFFKGVYLGFLLMTMIFLIELASGLIHIDDITPDIRSTLLGGFILQGIVALGEELPFRGYVLPDLAKRFGTWNAIFLSSLFFSVLHIPSILTLNMGNTNVIIMLLTITIAEILLAICYLYDGLSMSIGFHFTWNFLQYHVYSLRQDFGGVLEITTGNRLLTGGAFGPEAGLLGMFVVILAFIVVFWWLQSR